MPAPLQGKLLRAVDERLFEPVGSNKSQPVQARLVAISNCSLEREVAAGRFRADLYHRLNVVAFALPPLRERRQAVLPLARRFLAEFAGRNRPDVTGLSPGGKLPALGPDSTGGLWDVLALEVTPRASKAVWTLVAAGKAGADLLSKSVYVTDPKKLDQLIKDLDSARFVVRERAMVSLEKYGKWIQGRLEKEMENPPSLEVERRLKTKRKPLGLLMGMALPRAGVVRRDGADG